MAGRASLLGVAPAAHAEPLLAALRTVEGPAVTAHVAGEVALLAEVAGPARRLLAARGRKALYRGLHRMQRRLEIACLNGPFLAFDPAAAACAVVEIPGLLAASAGALAEALMRDGSRHQWDVVLRWTPEAALAPHRAALAEVGGRVAMAAAVAEALRTAREERLAALRAALAAHGAALAADPPAEGDTETGATVLIPRGGEAAIEAALNALPEALKAGASADLRGPLPPVSFAPLRVTALEAAAVEAAWRTLGLPERLERDDLTRRWRELAIRLHPDQAGLAADAARLDEAGRAYKLLRGLARSLPDQTLDLAALRARSGPQLSIPEAA